MGEGHVLVDSLCILCCTDMLCAYILTLLYYDNYVSH